MACYEERLYALVGEAHRQGLQVHACFDEINAYPTMPALDEHIPVMAAYRKGA